jgi:hypothetical protein
MEKEREEKPGHRSRSSRHRHRDSGESDQERRVKRRERSRERESSPPVDRSPERTSSNDHVPASEGPNVPIGESPAREDGSATTTTTTRVPVRIGPQLPPQATTADELEMERRGGGGGQRAYGKALLPGEGSAMANFVQEGKRIPRRGEIGLSSDQIEGFEKQGYVMSGSRHQRMNAVRMRKENQIISAEEQRSILKMRAEEKQKKEAEIVAQFKDMIDSMGD